MKTFAIEEIEVKMLLLFLFQVRLNYCITDRLIPGELQVPSIPVADEGVIFISSPMTSLNFKCPHLLQQGTLFSLQVAETLLCMEVHNNPVQS